MSTKSQLSKIKASVSIIEETQKEEDIDEKIPFTYSITSYGADYTIDSLVKRIEDGSIFVPIFQRGYVWKFREASRFIESLLLGLPIPGIFLAKEEDTKKLLVIDGHQRLRTLQYFYKGFFEPTKKEFALKDVQEQFEGITYQSLSSEQRRDLDDSIVHATIVKQDEYSDDNSSIYNIFERLNTGGTQLKSQEIRSCIYHGAFNDLLKELNGNKSWRAIYGDDDSSKIRMRDEELILRFLALYFSPLTQQQKLSYKKPMKEFLNLYMGKNKHLIFHSEIEIRQAFEPTIELIYKTLGNKAFKPKRDFNAAVFDAVMIGIARRLSQGNISDLERLPEKYEELLRDPEFRKSTVDTARTTEEDVVNSRIKIATQIFADL
ncbi:MAG: DUF262 domain-containing protein [Microcoleaceae cyanobacterium]|jgi:hypothetical protein